MNGKKCARDLHVNLLAFTLHARTPFQNGNKHNGLRYADDTQATQSKIRRKKMPRLESVRWMEKKYKTTRKTLKLPFFNHIYF